MSKGHTGTFGRIITDENRRVVWARIQNAVLVTEAGCWEWQRRRESFGYGRVSIGGSRQAFAHRASYELFIGPIPPGLYVCHHCDNPPCIRPDHLYLGTAADNMLDAMWKGHVGGSDRTRLMEQMRQTREHNARLAEARLAT